MTYSVIRNISYSFSVVFHILLLLLFLLISINIDYAPREYVELSFGNSGGNSSAGSSGSLVEDIQRESKSQEKNETVEKNEIVKKIDLPKAKNTDEKNVIKPVEKNKEKESITTAQNTKQAISEVSSTGQGNNTQGEGGFGFDIDWGGKGKRQIWSYPLPKYPSGVYKEIDIKIMFTIKPDGSVGSTRLLTKADTKLENAALNSLRQWRFEPLSTSQKQIDQTAVIVFPYRLD
ncbi:MAG: energy transducer TonB [Ignavibacteriaceae bacterium]|nr:energy transducer TonB [Ignavibacteriaceae bacterium]